MPEVAAIERDLSEFSMLELFRAEAEGQAQVLTHGLLLLEREPTHAEQLEACMRAAHSLKGAARIVGLDAGVSVAHAMEDCFVAAQQGQLVLGRAHIDLMLRGLDLLLRIGNAQAPPEAGGDDDPLISSFLIELAALLAAPAPAVEPAVTAPAPAPAALPEPPPRTAPHEREPGERALRVTAENLNRLLGLASESLVESRWLKPFAHALLRMKRQSQQCGQAVERLREMLSTTVLDEAAANLLHEVQQRVLDGSQLLQQRLLELEAFDARSANLANRLYGEALASRMRPFADGIGGWPRMLRDVARTLEKEVRLSILGHATQVDREILEQLDAPIGHLLRNALDHGIETPAQRRAAGKPAEGTITLEARHSAGVLQISVADDGSGIDLARLRETVVTRGLTSSDLVQRMSDAEVLEFLFLPGFSMKGEVTAISGRGVGLDAVQDMLKQVRGSVRVHTQPGVGTRFTLQLPLTLSVVRTLLAQIGGEPYAFPLAYIRRTLKLPRTRIQSLEGRQHFELESSSVGLVRAQQVLGGSDVAMVEDWLPVIVLGDEASSYGLVVERFLGERELVVQPLDPRLGKIKDIAAGALMEDGAPVLIVDVDDLIRSVEKLVMGGRLDSVREAASQGPALVRKRVLVVDDSLTVREVERKLLQQGGFEVEVAVDGVDGWNALRAGHFDLVVTDIDMPRMDGIALVLAIRKDAALAALPVMIVSYKDREEDRRRGLEAGADYYLTKGSFHDETLLQAAIDLIGEARQPVGPSS